MNGLLRRYAIGILPRYVMAQVAKAFALALLMLTSVFVLVVVVAKAADGGARAEGDRGDPAACRAEHLAIHGAGGPAVRRHGRLRPGRLGQRGARGQGGGLGGDDPDAAVVSVGGILSAGLMVLSNDLIPSANHEAKAALFRNLEEMFYRILKKERSFDNPAWPFKIEVRDVEGHDLIGARFSHRDKDGGPDSSSFDFHVLAVSGEDPLRHRARGRQVKLENAVVTGDYRRPDKLSSTTSSWSSPCPATAPAVRPLRCRS